VYSHPVALNQCLKIFRPVSEAGARSFLRPAGSVKMVIEENGPESAAIASDVAASIYGGTILKKFDRGRPAKFHALLFAVSVEEAAAAAACQGMEDFAGVSRRATFQALCSAA